MTKMHVCALCAYENKQTKINGYDNLAAQESQKCRKFIMPKSLKSKKYMKFADVKK